MYYFMALIKSHSACIFMTYDFYSPTCANQLHMSANIMDQDKCYKTKHSHNIVVIYPALTT